MISLRITEDEYETVKQMYRSIGARSFSDFARRAMRRVMEQPRSPDGGPCPRLQELGTRVEALEDRLASLLERERQRVAGDGGSPEMVFSKTMPT